MATSQASGAALPAVQWISNTDLFNKLQFGSNTMLIDLQSAENFKKFHIRSALNVDWVKALEFAEENSDFDDPALILKHVSDIHDRRFRLRAFCQLILYGGMTDFGAAERSASGEAAACAIPADSPDQLSSRELVMSFAECLLSEKKVTKDILLVEGGIELVMDSRPYLIKGMDSFCDIQFPSEIIEDLLYLGSFPNASNRRGIELLGITHVVNATNDCPSSFDGELKYIQCEVEDDLNSDISQYFQPVLSFIDTAVADEKNRVLIHCKMGMSRSTAFVILYLMKSRRMSLRKAYNFTKSARPFVNPNPSFLKQLSVYEKSLFGSSTIRFPDEALSLSTLYEWLQDDGKTWKKRVVVRTAS